MNGKYRQKLLDHVKQSATERAIQKAIKATSYLICNKFIDKIIKFSKTSPPNNSEATTKNMIKKYLKKDIYHQKKDRKLLMIWDWYNSIIMKYRKIAETTGDLLVNKIVDKITKFAKHF